MQRFLHVNMEIVFARKQYAMTAWIQPGPAYPKELFASFSPTAIWLLDCDTGIVL